MTQSPAQDATIIPDLALDSKTFKKLLMEQVRARGGSDAIDTKLSLVCELTALIHT